MKLKKGHKLGIVAVVVVSVVGGGIYLKIEKDKAYALKVSTYYSKLNKEQKDYVDANDGLIDDILSGDKSTEIYLQNRFSEDVNGAKRVTKDSYIMGDYIRNILSANGGDMSKAVVQYIKEIYNTDVEVIGTTNAADGSLQLNIKDSKNDIEAYLRYKSVEGTATDSYGAKLTSKILSDKLTNKYKGVMPEGFKIMTWLNSAVSVTEQGSIDSLISADIDTIIQKVEDSSYPINCINVYLPVNGDFKLQDTKVYLDELLAYGAKDESGEILSKANIFFVKGKNNVEPLMKELYNTNPFKDASIKMSAWDAKEGVFAKGSQVSELKLPIADKVYGYIRVDSIDKFKSTYKYDAKENLVVLRDVAKAGYMVKWYGEGVKDVDFISIEEQLRAEAKEDEKAKLEAEAKVKEEGEAKVKEEGEATPKEEVPLDGVEGKDAKKE